MDLQTARDLKQALLGDNSTQAAFNRTLEMAEEFAAARRLCENCRHEISATAQVCPICESDPSVELSAALTTKQRNSLSDEDFVFPDKAPGPGSYPINDRAHGANALARAKGKPEFATVKAKVCKRYGDLPECGGDNDND